MWSQRRFLWLLAYSRVKASYAGTTSAAVWWFLEPALQLLMYAIVFGVVLPESSRPDDFVVSLVFGLAVFNTFQSASIRGTTLISESRGLESVTNVTRWSLAAAAVIETLVRAFPFFLLSYITAILFGISPTWAWFAAPIALLWSSLLLYAVILITATLTCRFPNFPRILRQMNRLVFYASGIFWSVEKVLDGAPMLVTIANLNPVYQLIAICRGSILSTDIEWAWVLATNAVMTSGLILIATMAFAKTGRDCNG